ncbi:hypothetical protein [Candidatus Mesenet endosymbiont of Phosphuga atrata]|uniref:hypothetical protein n=1 Tax=Candidatus Mesenet endosymbiont of Phosphuga atrata TaxID=3066221 RepID=UPI0030D16F4C
MQLNDDLQVVLCYNKLSDKELKVIKHKIKDAFDEYEELFGIEDHGTKTITFFLHDNEKDHNDYGYSYANYLLRQFDLDQTNILNAYHHVGHSNIPIRTQISYALSHHNVGRGLAMLPDREEVMELPDTEIQGNELEEDDSDYDDEYVGMQYKIIDDSLHITDSETNDTVKIPKQFKYLKLEEDDEGEYKLVLCDKKGHALSDNKKYAKIDDKYKYINTKAVNLDEDIEFDDYDGEDLFFIQPDETNSQVAKILDVYEDEIGMLSNNDFI